MAMNLPSSKLMHYQGCNVAFCCGFHFDFNMVHNSCMSIVQITAFTIYFFPKLLIILLDLNEYLLELSFEAFSNWLDWLQ